MPLYEYHCLDCRKRSTILVLSVTNQSPPQCAHCRSPRMERLMSRFSSPKSEEARLASLADPDALNGLDENDPESMSRFMKQMGDELGEDVGDDLGEAADSLDATGDEMTDSDSL